VSSTHGYHVVALMRSFLGAGSAPATVKASASVAGELGVRGAFVAADAGNPANAKDGGLTV